MMIVVSDASPVNILIRLGQIDILGVLFGRVVLPASVAEELSRPATPPVVRAWIAKCPAWLSVETPTTPSSTGQRHRGETDAIQLALELRADAILLDEDKPRKNAAAMGLRVIGTVGVLEIAANRGLIPDLKAVHDQMRKTDFFVSDELLQASLARHVASVKSRRDP